MNDILDFLSRLSENNERAWFLEHKSEYEMCKSHFEAFAAKLIERISQFDSTVKGLSPKDCTYRIYKDVRFSKDKRPYKTHMGCYICRGGKKSPFSGYYFHLQAAGTESMSISNHLLAIGDYMCDSCALRIIREDIENYADDFLGIMESAGEKGLYLSGDYRLKRVPRGFDAEGRMAEWLKYKVYTLTKPLTMEDVSDEDALLDYLTDLCRTAHPFLDFINRAIEYSVEEKNPVFSSMETW